MFTLAIDEVERIKEEQEQELEKERERDTSTPPPSRHIHNHNQVSDSPPTISARSLTPTTAYSYDTAMNTATTATIASIATKGEEEKENNKLNRSNRDDNSNNTEEDLIHQVALREHMLPLVTPVITPRFVPSCTATLLQALGDLAKSQNLPIQSHLSESVNEIKWVSELHPECENYADIYQRYNLLYEKSYFAHCCHCTTDEKEILYNNQSGVSHCPSSNFMLGSGVLNVRKLLLQGIKVGLGTDVAGGYSSSILDALRQAIIASRCISFGEKDPQTGQFYEALSYHEAFFLATQGGADVLSLGNSVGNFLPGKYFDACVVDPTSVDGPMDIFNFQEEDCENKHMKQLQGAFEKFIFLGDDRNIDAVYVGGNQVC